MHRSIFNSNRQNGWDWKRDGKIEADEKYILLGKKPKEYLFAPSQLNMMDMLLFRSTEQTIIEKINK